MFPRRQPCSLLLGQTFSVLLSLLRSGKRWKGSKSKKKAPRMTPLKNPNNHRINFYTRWGRRVCNSPLLGSVGCRAFWTGRKETLLCSAVGLSRFPNRLVASFSPRFSPCLAVRFVSDARCVSAALLSSLADESRSDLPYPGLGGMPCFSSRGSLEGMCRHLDASQSLKAPPPRPVLLAK